jgi:DNA mismatch repair protein MutS2
MLSAKTRADLGWNDLLSNLASRTRSKRAHAAALALEALADLDAIRSRQEEVQEARALRDRSAPLPLGEMRDLEEVLARSEKGGILEPQSLRDVAITLRTAASVRRHLSGRAKEAPRLLGRAALIAPLEDLWERIGNAFEDGPSGTSLRLSDRASPALSGLRRGAQRLREELEHTLERLLDSNEVSPHLQDRFFTQREDRYVVPIRVDARTRVRGIVHGLSQSGQTVFIEPEAVVGHNNRLKLLELEVAEEERRIFSELSLGVEEALPQIHVNIEVLGALDLMDAAAGLAIDLRAAPPEMTREGALDLRHARHPLMVLAGRNCVPIDVVVDFGQTLVISGPNAGGKTVALKTAGLLALLARAGLHIPAQEGSKVPLFSEILSDVGDDQSLERNLSTFSAHVIQLRAFFEVAKPGVLILLDEIAVGTDPDQGAALAQSVLEGLAERGATVLLTTHYDRLKLLPAHDPRFINASVGFDLETLAPTYRLELGLPGASLAIVVAGRLGLPEAVCTRATTLLDEGQVGMEKLLLDLEAERRKLTQERVSAESIREEAEAAHAEARRRVDEAQKHFEAARRGAHDEAVDTLRRARRELERTATVLRRSAGQVTPAELSVAEHQIAEAAAAVHAAAPAPAAPPGRPVKLEELTAGLPVFMIKLGGHGRVLAPPKGRKVAVQVGALKLHVEVDDLRIVDTQASERSRRAERGHSGFDEVTPAGERRGGYLTVDVRGERIDVALGMAEKLLDDALRVGDSQVVVIHGHGTGALRESLRDRLSDFPGVTGLRPGKEGEGGDGVTVVVLE